jgi:hypothetical protein
MDYEVASGLQLVIAAVAAVVWLIALRFLLASSQRGQTGQPQDAGESGDGWLSGSAEVEGEAATLATRAASILAKGNQFAFGPVKILEKDDSHVRFERVGPSGGNQQPGQWFRRGELRFTPLRSDRTRVEWAFEPANVRWLLWLGAAFQATGLVALVVGGWAIHTYIASSPDPNVRWQTVQMVQVVHFLWPPFLFGGLYRMGTRGVAAQFEALAHNLPYCES